MSGIDTSNICAIIRFLCDLFPRRVHDWEAEFNGVNCILHFPSKILPRAREESLREVKATDPVNDGGVFVHPFRDEVQAGHEVVSPSTQGLQGRVGLLLP